MKYGIYLKCDGCGATLGGEQVTANPEPPLVTQQGGELRERAAERGWTTYSAPAAEEQVSGISGLNDRCPNCTHRHVLTQTAVLPLAAQLAADIDVELRAAITRRLGRSGWTLEELAGRLHRVKDVDERGDECGTTYYLDGLKLLGIQPAEPDERLMGHLARGHGMVAALKFLRYAPKPETPTS